MNNQLITRRQALRLLAALGAGTLVKPSAVWGAAPVADRLRFAVLGDWGTGGDEQRRVLEQMLTAHAAKPLDFVIGAGDNIYPNGSGRLFGEKFERPFAPLLRARVPFYTVLGNHDVLAGRRDQCEYPPFNMGRRCYYSFRPAGNLAEFLMLDSTDFSREQAAWLEGALRASSARWKVAVFHHPIYSSGRRHGSDLRLRRELEPLLVRYGVAAAFSGHDHIYERTKPQQGVQYFVSGAAGELRRGDTDLKSELRAASFDQDNHFMLVDLEDRQIGFQAICQTGNVVDRGAIKQA